MCDERHLVKAYEASAKSFAETAARTSPTDKVGWTTARQKSSVSAALSIGIPNGAAPLSRLANAHRAAGRSAAQFTARPINSFRRVADALPADLMVRNDPKKNTVVALKREGRRLPTRRVSGRGHHRRRRPRTAVMSY